MGVQSAAILEYCVFKIIDEMEGSQKQERSQQPLMEWLLILLVIATLVTFFMIVVVF